jgi:ABC-type oligopeptide transport system substrate-binding subunit
MKTLLALTIFSSLLLTGCAAQSPTPSPTQSFASQYKEAYKACIDDVDLVAPSAPEGASTAYCKGFFSKLTTMQYKQRGIDYFLHSGDKPIKDITAQLTKAGLVG